MSFTKNDRVKIVNQIIKEIAIRGRNFFKHENEVADIIIKNGRLYMVSEWHGRHMPLQTKYGAKPKGWHHGGTLWALTRDFAEFIRHGKPANGVNGYGGLYCAHWGYPKEDMEAICAKAKELGYLK